MAYCGELTENISALDCNNPGVAGVNGSKGWIINYDDIDRATSVVSASGVISDLNLVAGKYAYLIETDPDGIEPSWKYAPGAYRRDQVEQIMSVKIFDPSPTNKQRIVDLSKGKFVVILERNGIKNNPTAPEVKGDNVFEAWGWDTGLIIGADTASDYQDADTGGGITLQLTTSDRRKENRPPYSVFITSYALTVAMLEALEEPTTP
jgi:hypothetical protein